MSGGGGGTTEPLPSWLTFDPARATFAGVPTQGDLRPHLVAVKAVGTDGSSARDVFMVDVLQEPGEEDGGGDVGEEMGRMGWGEDRKNAGQIGDGSY